MELEFTERRTYDVHNTEKISIRLTSVGLAQARPNYKRHTKPTSVRNRLGFIRMADVLVSWEDFVLVFY